MNRDRPDTGNSVPVDQTDETHQDDRRASN